MEREEASYALPDQGVVYSVSGGGEKWSWAKLWGQREDKKDGIKLTSWLFIHTYTIYVIPNNTVRPLCSLTLSAFCSVFVRTSLLQNPENPVHLLLTKGFMCIYQYLLIYYHIGTYIMGIGIYTRIYIFLVHITDNLIPVVIWIYHYSHPLCVPIYAQVISFAHVSNRYWDIYENIT